MTNKISEDVIDEVVDFTKNYFDSISEKEKEILPPVLNPPNYIISIYDEVILGLIFLDVENFTKVKNQQKHLPPFPGFIVSEEKKPTTVPVAFKISGTCNIFSSNHITNMFAFSVEKGSSFTVINHFQEIINSSGEKLNYKIDVAFILGLNDNEEIKNIKQRIKELLDHTMSVWRNI